MAVKMIRSIMPHETEHMVNIKLPSNTNLSQIIKDMDTINFIFDQLFNIDPINTIPKFSNFDSGTSWLSLILTGTSAVSFLGSLVWAACVIRKKKSRRRFIN